MLEKTVVHVPTREEYIALMEWCQENGYTWSGDPATARPHHYNSYGNKTCVNLDSKRLYYADKDFYVKEGYTVISLTELFALVVNSQVSSITVPTNWPF